MKHIFITLILLLTLSVAVQAQRDKDLDRLVGYMQGGFDSAAQAAKDTNYFDISLHMARIWAGRDDGYWLYVEQALTTMAEKRDAAALLVLGGTGRESCRFAGR